MKRRGFIGAIIGLCVAPWKAVRAVPIGEPVKAFTTVTDIAFMRKDCESFTFKYAYWHTAIPNIGNPVERG